MATGEWSSKGKEAKKFNFEPFPPGEYELKLLGDSTETRRKQEPGALPYNATRFEALGTATGEGGKNRLLFHNFFLSLKPGKGGDAMPERADQLAGFGKALGDEPQLPTQEYNIGTPDVPSYVTILDALVVKKWLIAHDGAIVKAKVKVDRGSKDYGPKNVVEFFIEAEGGQEQEGGGGEYDATFEQEAAAEQARIEAAHAEDEAESKKAAGGKKRR